MSSALMGNQTGPRQLEFPPKHPGADSAGRQETQYFRPPALRTCVPNWIAPLFAGLAGVFVAMERALGFGARWRYHCDMYYGYDAIIDMLAFYPVVPPNEQSKYARDIYTALYALRSRESAIPNAGTNTSPT
jgi:hypothetical protein